MVRICLACLSLRRDRLAFSWAMIYLPYRMCACYLRGRRDRLAILYGRGLRTWQGYPRFARFSIALFLASQSFSLCSNLARTSGGNWLNCSSRFFLNSASCFSTLRLDCSCQLTNSCCPGGLTYMVGGYSPICTRIAPEGRMFGSRISLCCESNGHPLMACQSSECKKSISWPPAS